VDETAVKDCVDARAVWLAGLVGPPRGASERSLYASYNDSWHALSDAERDLAASLSGFLTGLPGHEG
jgi:hypothetical protein